jgi:hypothetical protein
MTLEEKLLLWGTIAKILAALATFLAVLVAIWGDRIRHTLGLKPKLVVRLNDPYGELVNVSTSPEKPMMARYYHLRVSNKRRWSQAKNVRVVIVRVFKPAADGALVPQTLAGPLQLMWRFTPFHPQYSTVGSDDFVDLGHLQKGKNFYLTPYISPSNLEGFLRPNEQMRVEVQAVADNAESKSVCIDISWDGHWSDGSEEMTKHLVVTQVECTT